jgi:hypothetical protein
MSRWRRPRSRYSERVQVFFRALVRVGSGLLIAVTACEGPGKPTGGATFELTFTLSPEKPAEVITLRARSRTPGDRKHQLSIHRGQASQGRTRGPDPCNEFPDLLFQIETPGRPTPPASAFEGGYKCWFGSCPSRCYTLSGDGQQVLGVAPSCQGTASYVTLECEPSGQDCEQVFRVRILAGTRGATIDVPLEVSLTAIGDEAPVTAELIRAD